MKAICLLGCLFIYISVNAQDKNLYSSTSIADSLKEGANSVYRLDEAYLEIASASKYTMRVHQVVTLLNREAAHYLSMSLGSNKFQAVNEVDIKVYNDEAVIVKHFTKKDFAVEAAFDGMSLFTDDKRLNLKVNHNDFPCTIEVSYLLTTNSYIELPDWVLNNQHASIEKFRFVAAVAKGIDIRYRSSLLNITPAVETINNQTTYTWEAKNLRSNNITGNGYELINYLPRIEISPIIFSYDGYQGSLSSWKDFGTWNYQLYEEKKPFSDARIQEIKGSLQSYKTDKEKIAFLYDYLKKNVRYVSIQLGIGGFKPFSSKFVDENKYGDCKALTNYMRNLLSVAGITSYPALINAGYNKKPVDESFPNNVFNHVILCIPLATDTTWLECTSNENKPGFLGSFTENKKALLLTEKGGVLINTPKSNSLNNLLFSTHHIYIDDVSTKVLSNIKSSGDNESIYRYAAKIEQNEQKEFFVRYLNYKEPDVLKQGKIKDSVDFLVSEFELQYNHFYDFRSGNKFFAAQHFFSFCDEKISSTSVLNDWVIDHPYSKTDTTIFHLPKKYKPENLPPLSKFENEMGAFQKLVHFNTELNILTIVTSLSVRQSFIPAAKSHLFADLINHVNMSEDEKIVFIEND